MKVIETFEEAKALFAERQQNLEDPKQLEAVRGVLQAVREKGDLALRELTKEFDGVDIEEFRVPLGAFSGATLDTSTELKEAIRLAAGRIRAFYERQPRGGFLAQVEGAMMGQVVRPLDSVACYVPGGQAPLFSSLLMTAIPAQVAGVREVVVASPPNEEGFVPAEILVAAREIGVSTVYRVGGPLAIAALAYGTETIARVDKIVGPGSALTMIAKKLVFGDVGIEALPGPTETLIIADDLANPEYVAADLLAQAEHENATPILLTTSESLLKAVKKQLDKQVKSLSTKASAQSSLQAQGVLVRVEDMDQAIALANSFAAEHLCLLVKDPWSLLPEIRHAGGVFMGESSMEALGDYLAGPSHVMPTGSSARFSSALNLRDFQKIIPVISMPTAVTKEIGPAAAIMARAEGLEAHARAIESRLKD